MEIFDRKINIEVTIGSEKAMVKMLAVTPYAEVRIQRNFNEIVKKYRIPYKSLVSNRFDSPEYAMATTFIENQMLERGLEIHIYSFEKIETKTKRKIVKNILCLVLRVAITVIFLYGILRLYHQAS